MIEKKKTDNGLFMITVKAVIVNEEGKVLIMKRSPGKDYKIAEGKYDLPGGSLTKNESIENSLRREIKEETDLDVEIGPVVHAIDFNQELDDVDYSFKGLRLVAFHKKGEVKLSWEHESFEWLDVDDAINKLEDTGFEKDKREALIKTKEYLGLKNSLNYWKRCQADFENYKKDQARHLEEFRKYAKMDVIEQILPVVDNFEASLAHVPEKSKENKWVEGIVYIKKQLEDVLRNNDIEEIPVKVGDKFDPEIHEAIGGDGKKQIVKKILQKGYKLNSRILRAAKVEVE